MRIAVIGGGLQGLEACYLAGKAGFTALLMDKREYPPARGLCDEFLHCDVCSATQEAIALLRGADMVLPALEDPKAIEALERLTERYGFNMAFDFAAFDLTRSKKRCDELFRLQGIPAPEAYPDCPPPYIFKPSCGSGSALVRRFDTAEALKAHIASWPHSTEYVAQRYIEGPSYSIEVIGEPGKYKAYQVTQIHTDAAHDCNRVTCPCGEAAQPAALEDIALRLAELIGLRGIMDVESILDENGVHRVLEIDARLPSQTPTAIYHSTGINMLCELARLFCDRECAAPPPMERHVSFEHAVLNAYGVSVRPGEHIMAERPPVSLWQDALGALEVITDGWQDGKLIGTFIFAADTAEELEAKRRGIGKPG